MSIRTFLILIGCTASMIAMNADSAQAARTAHSALRVHCLKQVGAYYHAGKRTYRFYGARSSPQRQNFYNCLDAHTMKRR
jgi:hypothetical protein